MEPSNSWGLTKNVVKWLHWHGPFCYAPVAGKAAEGEGGPADPDGAKQMCIGKFSKDSVLRSLNSEDL
jgi:hypothetical protein